MLLTLLDPIVVFVASTAPDERVVCRDGPLYEPAERPRMVRSPWFPLINSWNSQLLLDSGFAWKGFVVDRLPDPCHAGPVLFFLLVLVLSFQA